MLRHDSILQTIGRTPVVRLARLSPAGVNVYAKLEARNPMGSVKDRLALAVIEDAERRGVLRPGQTVVEATSGNTGIGLAMVCARKDYPLVVVMAENFSIERRRLMRFLGAKLVLTPAAEKGSGMMRKAEELAAAHGWFLCRQFENPANAAAHFETTGPEILAAFADAPLDWFVAGCGTGGTIGGVARFLRSASPRTRIVACEPENAPLLGSGTRQPRSADGAPAGSHPAFRPHPMQGWTPDFISPLTEAALDASLVDRVLPVAGQAALEGSRALARREGILTGITGGATLAGALAIAAEAPRGSNILCLLPDTGERYLSTPLFADVPVEMTEEELALSRSTPSARFDVPASAAAPVAASAQVPAPVPAAATAAGAPVAARASGAPVDAEADASVAREISGRDNPVVMFALEWCEFCWTLRRLFAACGIAFRSVDLDSVQYQADNRGGRIREALRARTGVATIPQVFVGGEFVGGCTDVIAELRAGRLQQRLAAAGASFTVPAGFDPARCLPNWLHAR
ncbi:MAG: pyridoxal-phosphate dependent enzyme [Steroidobacteraceae bacterium]